MTALGNFLNHDISIGNKKFYDCAILSQRYALDSNEAIDNIKKYNGIAKRYLLIVNKHSVKPVTNFKKPLYKIMVSKNIPIPPDNCLLVY